MNEELLTRVRYWSADLEKTTADETLESIRIKLNRIPLEPLNTFEMVRLRSFLMDYHVISDLLRGDLITFYEPPPPPFHKRLLNKIKNIW